ncbi:MAG: nif-specific transcriptional activator NifA [Alphaproteobacteria bacterium]
MLHEKRPSLKGATSNSGPKHLSEIALSGIYEISKILVAPNRLERTLANVLNLLSSFMDMQNGTIVLLDDDDTPEMVVGAKWTEEGETRHRTDLPQKALDQLVATATPLVVQNVGDNPLFAGSSIAELARSGERVAFIGVPIRIDAKVVGTLSISRIRHNESQFRYDLDVRFLSMIANLIGQTIQLHRVILRDRERLMAESRRLEKQLASEKSGAQIRDPRIVGESSAIRSLLAKIAIVAKSNATVLLRGESGTGKELFSRAIHEASPRANAPFVKVNCAALPESVLESELFGHEKGAFTGAISARKGRFELADGGTLFLDEIGEISPAFQAKLLRVLQEGEFDRIGGTKTQKVNVRIVAATNRDLEEAVASGEFRADLYYRINVVPLLLPPLRERKGDLPLLASAFLNRFNKENGRKLAFTPAALGVLKACYFPGNIRELENCICRTATLAQGVAILPEDFACGHGECLSATLWRTRGHTPSASESEGFTPLPVAPVRPARNMSPGGSVTAGSAPMEGEGNTAANVVSRESLIQAMEKTGWVQAKAARLLGITPRQIGYALRKNGIDIKKL